MIGFKVFSSTPTDFDLNGPILSYTVSPFSTSVCGVATFVGIATATFPNSTVGLGTVVYQWYEVGEGALSDTSTVTGTATTTLTLTSLVSPDDNGRQFFQEITYAPSGTTARAQNQPLTSDILTLNRKPDINILVNPISATAITNDERTFTVAAEPTTDTTDVIGYQWLLNGDDASDGTTGTFTLSGTNNPVLTIESSAVGLSTVQCRFSLANACDSPKLSTGATFTVVSPDDTDRNVVDFEITGDFDTTLYDSGEQDLTDGELAFEADSDNPSRTIVIYSEEKDLPVQITLRGAAGATFGSNAGGEGGVAVFKKTLLRNVEYAIKLNPSQSPFAGTGGGGGGAFFYEKAVLLAACGGGGGASAGGKGGDGGGVSVAGEDGQGRNAGQGGALVPDGTLDNIGESVDGTQGGQTTACTIGSYYANIGLSPCADIGTEVPFRNRNGFQTEGTAFINRGYKPNGATERNNGGNSSTTDTSVATLIGGGGSGAVGGNASTAADSSGGGASGYSNGAITVLSTRLGGNTSTVASITIEAVTL